MQTDNPNAPDYDWQADREWFFPIMALMPCPFCGAGSTVSEADGKHWTGMRYVVLSWTVRHWCHVEEGRFPPLLNVRGRDQQQAEERWNKRATHVDASAGNAG